MHAKLITYFLPKGLDVSDWSAFSQSRYIIYGHLITILIAALGMAVNINPFDIKPFFIDASLIVIMLANLFLLQTSIIVCRLNFYIIVWAVIFGLATYVNPLFGYEYYFMIWSVSAVMLFTRKLIIYIFFAIGVCSFYLPKYLIGQTSAEFNFNPVFLFLMLLLIFQVFYLTNKYYVSIIKEKNTHLESDKLVIQEQANKLKEVSALQTRFFTNISHEIRTPLTLIMGPIKELIDSGHLLPPELKHLKGAHENSRRLLRLVEEILDLSKLETGHMNLHVVESDLSEFVKACVGMFESIGEKKGVTIKFAATSNGGKEWFDKNSVEKIITNLLINAFKNTDRGDTITVGITFNDMHACIRVEDTGHGISKQMLPRIFERFYHTESDLQSSAGIGLSIVKVLVETIKGTIQVESTEGKGSTFTVQLPIRKNQYPIGSIDKSTEKSSIAKPGQLPHLLQKERWEEEPQSVKMSILLIEDNVEVRTFIEELLNPHYSVLLASDGKEGETLALREIPDIIICDVMMPEKDGFEVASALKSNELTCHIPIIFLTARADKPSLLKGLSMHADEYITKPFDRETLLARISNLLDNRKRLRDAFANEPMINPEGVKVSSMDQQFVKKVVSTIKAHLSKESFSVELLGKEVGMSRSQIYRKLTAIIGRSPNQLIRTIRLHRAHSLLAQNAATIAEVAYKTGFSSPNYFSTCFLDEFGYSPGEVRKQIAE